MDRNLRFICQCNLLSVLKTFLGKSLNQIGCRLVAHSVCCYCCWVFLGEGGRVVKWVSPGNFIYKSGFLASLEKLGDLATLGLRPIFLHNLHLLEPGSSCPLQTAPHGPCSAACLRLKQCESSLPSSLCFFFSYNKENSKVLLVPTALSKVGKWQTKRTRLKADIILC